MTFVLTAPLWPVPAEGPDRKASQWNQLLLARMCGHGRKAAWN